MNYPNSNTIPSGDNYSLSVADTAVKFSDLIVGGTPPGISSCTIQAYATGLSDTTEALRFTIDGDTDPTTTIGFLVGKSDIINLRDINEIRNFKCIAAEVGVGVTLNVQFFKTN